MSEATNVEQKTSGAIVDYSRPVGWWCPQCEEDGPCFRTQIGMDRACRRIPRFLPLPTPEPVEVDEVETGEAEVVTLTVNEVECWYMDNECITLVSDDGLWNTFDDIAAASANARKKREGAK